MLNDIDSRLIHKNWTEGGTLLTNFSINQLSKYRSTVLTYFQKTGNCHLVISVFAYYPQSGKLLNGCSLHTLDRTIDLSDFWEIFYSFKPTNDD